SPAARWWCKPGCRSGPPLAGGLAADGQAADPVLRQAGHATRAAEQARTTAAMAALAWRHPVGHVLLQIAPAHHGPLAARGGQFRRPPAAAVEGAAEPGRVAVLVAGMDCQQRAQRRDHIDAAAAGAVAQELEAAHGHAGTHDSSPWMRPAWPGWSRVPRGSSGGASSCCRPAWSAAMRSASAGARRLASELNLDIAPTWVARPPCVAACRMAAATRDGSIIGEGSFGSRSM